VLKAKLGTPRRRKPQPASVAQAPAEMKRRRVEII